MNYFLNFLGIASMILLLKVILSDFFKKAKEEFVSDLKLKNKKIYKLIRVLDKEGVILEKSFNKHFLKLSKLFVICLFFNLIIFRLFLPQILFNFEMTIKTGFMIVLLAFTCFKLFYDYGLFFYYNFETKEKILEVIFKNIKDGMNIYKEIDFEHWLEEPSFKLLELLDDEKFYNLALEETKIFEYLLRIHLLIKNENLIFVGEREKEIFENTIRVLEKEKIFYNKNKKIKPNLYLVQE